VRCRHLPTISQGVRFRPGGAQRVVGALRCHGVAWRPDAVRYLGGHGHRADELVVERLGRRSRDAKAESQRAAGAEMRIFTLILLAEIVATIL
jgi:hypothetical protein